MRVKASVAAAAAVALVAALPAPAPAAKGCIFEDERANEKNLDTVERSLFCLTNLHRLRNGADPVQIDNRLTAAARAHSDDMIARGFFAHLNPEGAGPGVRAAAFGYPAGVGENLATNPQGTASELFDQWRNSTTGHNENMLLSRYQAAGMGVNPHCCPGFGAPPGVTGTQMFGLGPADTKDDALDFYASSGKCATAKERLYAKRQARKRARKNRRQRLGEQIGELKRQVKKSCKEPPGN
jgi:uncharacterized protein YkwD